MAVKNVSTEVFPNGEGVLGLSYHLLSPNGQTLVHDNIRTYLQESLQPGGSTAVNLQISAPAQPGDYRLEIDLVWEGVMWFKDAGNPPAVVDLQVESSR